MVHSFLLIGQSNAAGRGFIDEAQPLDNCDKRLKVLRNGRWHNMFRPINPDRPFSGTCFAERFAKEYALANPELEVGIIPCADGGTAIEQWQPGELLFENAVNCAKLAMRTSALVGVLWHQGESDCTPERCPHYIERFKVIMDALRKELGIPDLPILVGGIGDFIVDYKPSEKCLANYVKINEQLQALGREYPHCRFVSAEGLGSNADNLHFSAEALEEFGLRYYNEFQKMDRPKIATPNIQDDTARTELEQL